jgi:hypothetical protein
MKEARREVLKKSEGEKEEALKKKFCRPCW